jgi:cell division inhibitor SepF
MSGLWDRTLVYLGLREETDDAYDDAFDEPGEATVARFDADTDPHAERAPQRPADRRRAAPDRTADADRASGTDRPGRSERPVDRSEGRSERPADRTEDRPRTRASREDARTTGTGAARRAASTGPSAPRDDTDRADDRGARRTTGTPSARPTRRDPSGPDGSNVTRLPGSDVHVLPVTRGPSVHVEIVNVATFDEVEQVGRRARAGEPVLFDLRDADTTTARRVVDFVSGTVYALRGRLERVGARAFLVRPRGVELPEQERERLAEQGYRVPAGSEA